MIIQEDHVVTMHYTLTDPKGEVLDSSSGREPLAYLHGHGNIIAGLEKQISGKTIGDKFTAEVPAAEGYGLHRAELVVDAKRSQFPADAQLEPGMRFQAETPQGPRVAVIQSIDGEDIKVDTNHPLAGTDLTFAIEIVGVRPAAADEIDHGHVH